VPYLRVLRTSWRAVGDPLVVPPAEIGVATAFTPHFVTRGMLRAHLGIGGQRLSADVPAPSVRLPLGLRVRNSASLAGLVLLLIGAAAAAARIWPIVGFTLLIWGVMVAGRAAFPLIVGPLSGGAIAGGIAGTLAMLVGVLVALASGAPWFAVLIAAGTGVYAHAAVLRRARSVRARLAATSRSGARGSGRAPRP